MSEAAPKEGEFAEGKFWFTRRLGVVTVGLTSLAVEEIGTVESVELPEDGDDYSRGEVVVTIDGSNGALDVTAPASGFITEINDNAKKNPEIVAEDPFEEGWLFKIQIEDPTELKEL